MKTLFRLFALALCLLVQPLASAQAIVPVDGIWADPDPTKPGTGLGIAYRHGVLVVAIYSYGSTGPAQWYLLSGSVTNNVFTATLDKYTGGQCISCTYVGPSLSGNDGTLTITFTSSTTATVNYPGGRTGTIAPFSF